MGHFERLLPWILRHEGVSETNPTGLVDLPGDSGGVTNWGISQMAWLRIRHKFPSTYPTDVRQLIRDHAYTIYHTIYYLPFFDVLPLEIAFVLFDTEVNSGNATKILQRAIRAADDGKYGPETEKMIRLALRNEPKLLEDILWQRLAYYYSISKGSPTNTHFLATLWVPRLLHCRAEASKL